MGSLGSHVRQWLYMSPIRSCCFFQGFAAFALPTNKLGSNLVKYPERDEKHVVSGGGSGSVVELRTSEREVQGSNLTTAM